MFNNSGSLIILVIAVICASCASNGDAAETYDIKDLRQDFEQFRSIIENKTAGLYSDRNKIHEMLNSTEPIINKEMTEIEFYRQLAPIVAELKCGHSFLSVSAETEKFMKEHGKFFPLNVRIIHGKLYVVDDPFYKIIAPGTEILFINKEPSEMIIEKILRNMTTDGEDRGRPRYDAERWFASMYYSYIDNPDHFNMDLLEPDGGRTYQTRLEAVHDPALAKTSMGIVHETADIPYHLYHEKNYSMAVIPTFAISQTRKYNKELENFFKEIEQNNVPMLIIDLRGNYGGSTKPTVELFQYLINKPIPFYSDNNPIYLSKWKNPVTPSPYAFNGKLYILMDEAGFSMNSFLLSLLKYHEIGTLYGAQSSGGYMCSDASINAVLKNTGLRLRYSTQIFSTRVENLPSGRGIEPDVSVDWSISDYITGSDPVLAAVLKKEAENEDN